MKQLILVLATLIFASASLNAQVANATVSNDASSIIYKNGNLYQNGIKLSSNQVLQALGQETYDSAYKPAKGMRTAGIVIFSVGATATALGAGLAIYSAIDGSKSGVSGGIELGFGLITGGVGIAIGTVGGILWGVGNKKMKNIVPASNGVGVAINL